MTYQERKKQRVEHFEKNVKGWKQIPCVACNGTGYYDHSFNGRTPKCSSCKGTGKETVSPSYYKEWKEYKLKQQERL